MLESLAQSFENLRANRLRSFLTMFGILWGMISVVILSATGEGFRQGNEKVLRELGQNIAGTMYCGTRSPTNCRSSSAAISWSFETTYAISTRSPHGCSRATTAEAETRGW